MGTRWGARVSHLPARIHLVCIVCSRHGCSLWKKERKKAKSYFLSDCQYPLLRHWEGLVPGLWCNVFVFVLVTKIVHLSPLHHLSLLHLNTVHTRINIVFSLVLVLVCTRLTNGNTVPLSICTRWQSNLHKGAALRGARLPQIHPLRYHLHFPTLCSSFMVSNEIQFRLLRIHTRLGLQAEVCTGFFPLITVTTWEQFCVFLGWVYLFFKCVSQKPFLCFLTM